MEEQEQPRDEKQAGETSDAEGAKDADTPPPGEGTPRTPERRSSAGRRQRTP
jgi:hypothetical protein